MMRQLVDPLYLPLPKLKRPVGLAALAAGLPVRPRHPDFVPVEFPLKKMEEIFRFYGENDIAGIRSIDHYRLAMALVSNLQTMFEGKKERHGELCDRWLPEKGFAMSLFQALKMGGIFRVYLQKLFLRHEIVKSPHKQLMDNFYQLARQNSSSPTFIQNLVKIKENKAGFLLATARECLKSGKSPALFWDRLDLLYDDYVEREYIHKIEDRILDEIVQNPHTVDTKTIQKFLTLILDFKNKDDRLTKNLEKLIFAAEKTEPLQPHILEHVERHLKIPPNWDLVPGISNTAVKAFERLIGFVEFQYFEIIAQVIHDQLLTKDSSEQSRLRNRTFFWMNYRGQIESIKIFLNTNSFAKFRGNFAAYQSTFGVSERILDNLGTTDFDSEIVLILLGDLLIVEFFRGPSFKTILIKSGKRLYRDVAKSGKLRRDVIEELADEADFRVHHVYLWQKALMNFLAEKLGVHVPSNQVIISKQGSFKTSGTIPKAVIMNKQDPKIHEFYSGYEDLLEKTIQGHRKRVNGKVFVQRGVK